MSVPLLGIPLFALTVYHIYKFLTKPSDKQRITPPNPDLNQIKIGNENGPQTLSNNLKSQDKFSKDQTRTSSPIIEATPSNSLLSGPQKNDNVKIKYNKNLCNQQRYKEVKELLKKKLYPGYYQVILYSNERCPAADLINFNIPDINTSENPHLIFLFYGDKSEFFGNMSSNADRQANRLGTQCLKLGVSSDKGVWEINSGDIDEFKNKVTAAAKKLTKSKLNAF